MTEDKTPKPKTSRHPALPGRHGGPTTVEGRPQSVDARRPDDADDPFYSGMIGQEDRIESELDQWGRTEREREGKRPETEDYEVGYAKPPKKHQFRPGQSGNPNGRPRRNRGPVLPASLNDAIVRELARKQQVMIDGKSRKMTMEKVIARRMVTALATCEPKMMPYWLNSLLRSGFPQAVEEMREREQEKMRSEHEATIKALEKVDAELAEFFEREGIEKDEDYFAGREQWRLEIAARKGRGPRKARY